MSKRLSSLPVVRDMTSETCNKPVIEDIDYYLQKGAPHCDDDVIGAEPPGYAPALNDNEEESALKCYILDADKDISGNTVFINGEGMAPPPSKMLQMQNAINNLQPDTMSPGVQPGDVEAILSYVFAAVIGLVILSTVIYYVWGAVFSQPHGKFWDSIKKWRLKMPNWWFCPPAAQ